MKRIVLAVMAALVLCACPSYAKKAKKAAEVSFEVSMHCKKCADKITENVGFEKGVMDLKVDMAEKTVYIKYNPDKTNPETLEKAIEKLGYSAEIKAAPNACSDKPCCKNGESGCKDKCCKKADSECKDKCCKKEECAQKDTCCMKEGAKKECCKKDGCKKDVANSKCCKKKDGCKDSTSKGDCCK